jgi:tagaturonate reductase
VLAAEFIWHEDLNNISGMTQLVKEYLDKIQAEGMLNAVKSIL